MIEAIEIRPTIAKFARQMERVLRLHDAKKRGWKECSMLYLQNKLLEEVAELLTATTPNEDLDATWSVETIVLFADALKACLEEGQQATVTHEATDVANIAMMISDNMNEGEEAAEN